MTAATFEFTKAEINRRIAAHEGGILTLRDTQTRGLTLHRQRRDWVLRIERKINKKIHRIVLGEYGPSTDLRAVRAEAETIMSEIRSGTYLPAKVKAVENRAKVGTTLGEAFKLHQEVNPNLRPATVEIYAYGVLNLMGIPAPRDPETGRSDPVGGAQGVTLPIAALTTDQARLAYDSLSPASGASMLRSVRAIWATWADETDHEGRNPITRITAKRGRVAKVKARTGALAPDERKAWYAALERLARTSASHNTARALQFLFLTGMRRDEVLALSWNEIGNDSLSVPGERMKAHEALTRPLTPEMRRILADQRRMNPNSPWVFPASRGAGHLTDTRKTLRKLPTVITNHDLRRGFIVAGELAMVPAVAVKLLVGHSTSDITETYARAIASELPRIAEKIEAELLS